MHIKYNIIQTITTKQQSQGVLFYFSTKSTLCTIVVTQYKYFISTIRHHRDSYNYKEGAAKGIFVKIPTSRKVLIKFLKKVEKEMNKSCESCKALLKKNFFKKKIKESV